MDTTTWLFIILSGIIALSLALFQYWYKPKASSKLKGVFALFRFVTYFGVLLLIVNPKFSQNKVYIEKPNLIIAVDNSSSVKHLGQDQKAIQAAKVLSSNAEINNKFNVITYTFGNELKKKDSLQFSLRQTNINRALKGLSEIYKETIAPVVLISDGNQTYGNDYAHNFSEYKQPIYPIILGDTTVYADLKIQQLNVNKYAYLKNKFPVEVILVYNGVSNINSKFTVKSGNSVLYSEAISFSGVNNSKVVSFTLPANKVGGASYRAEISSISNEKNITNNIKNFAVEVIDQKTKIALVSDFSHPDLGALKKSIESNEQRSVFLLSPKAIESKIDDFQLVILNQPNYKFKKVFDLLNVENKNKFVIVGPKTDLSFYNSINNFYQQEITKQQENYEPELNLNYTPFIIEDLNFELLPPLSSNFGSVNFSIPYESILEKRIGSVSTGEPLLATFETNGKREAVLFGENIWQWRAQSFIETKSFNQFDNFIGKLIQYLASNKKKSRLNVEYEAFYQGNTNVVVKAQFFDKNYQFDSRSSLSITIINKVSKEKITYPLILKNNSFEIDLSSLPAAEYNFVVSTNTDNISKSGSFEILEYDVEQQFLNANVAKLQYLATSSKGKSYFAGDSNPIIEDLLNDSRYVSIQKTNKNRLPLIDWKYLLGIIVMSLSIEWFLRKYNGLI